MDITRGLRIPVYGLGCGRVRRRAIERTLTATGSVLSASMNPATGTASFDFDPVETDSRDRSSPPIEA